MGGELGNRGVDLSCNSWARDKGGNGCMVFWFGSAVGIVLMRSRRCDRAYDPCHSRRVKQHKLGVKRNTSVAFNTQP